MKLFSYKTEYQRRKELEETYGRWHKWFAWFPVFDNRIERNDEGIEKRIIYFYWLCYIERKILVGTFSNEYYFREIKDAYQKTIDKYIK